MDSSSSVSNQCLCFPGDDDLGENDYDHHQRGDRQDERGAATERISGDAQGGGPSMPQGPLCSHCASRGLREAWEARIDARRRLQSTELETSERLAHLSLVSPHRALAQLQDESQLWRDRLQALRHRAEHLAYQVAEGAFQVQAANDRVLRCQQALHAPAVCLEQLQSAYLRESLATSLDEAQRQARRLRYAWAFQALRLHRIYVGADAAQLQKDRHSLARGRLKQARGVGKIGGLPLPHAGPELFGVLPPVELQSALRLVASVVSLVARCLKIGLPHPLALKYSCESKDNPGYSTSLDDIVPDFPGYAVDATMASESVSSSTAATEATKAKPPHKATTTAQDVADFLSSSTASLASLWRGKPPPSSTAAVSESFLSRAARNVAGGGLACTRPASSNWREATERAVLSAASPLSTDPRLVQQRLHHARWAVVAEDATPQSSRYALAPSSSTATSSADSAGALPSSSDDDEERFAIALQLLQDDLVVLCIRAGVPVDRLWPAEAVLLNLHELQLHCHAQAVSAASSAPSESAAVPPPPLKGDDRLRPADTGVTRSD